MEHKVQSPILPTHQDAQRLLRVLDGQKERDYLEMHKAIKAQLGTPQNPVDWTNPDAWIPERLHNANANFAQHIWTKTQQQLNPRHTEGVYWFIKKYKLVDVQTDTFAVTDLGQAFLRNDAALLHDMDRLEGLDVLLDLIAQLQPVAPMTLEQPWSEFVLTNSRFGTRTTIHDTMRRRLNNLLARDLVAREHGKYSITDEGRRWLALDKPSDNAPSEDHHLLRAVQQHNQTERQKLRDFLTTMHPYDFEHLVAKLLGAMGYEDVEVTKQSGDKGVDVVAKIQLGISRVTEVVQVKRQQSNLGRPLVDQLRGALPYHKAIRGTIITLGKVSKNVEEAALHQGAAPITLIDGETLIDLLIHYNIGMHKKLLEVHELNTNFVANEANEEPNEETGGQDTSIF